MSKFYTIKENKFENNKFKKFMESLLQKNNGAGTLNDYSEYDLVNLLNFDTNLEKKNDNEYKTENEENNFLDKSKKEEIIFNVFENEKEEKILIEKTYESLVKYLKLCGMNDDAYNSLIEEKFVDIYDTYGSQFLADVLNKISLDYFDKPKILSIICDCLHVFDLEEVYPWGPILVTSYISNKNEELKSDAVYLISSWSDKSLLPLLKNIEYKSKWLQDYISEVVEMLED